MIPKVSIIILNYNGKKFNIDCLNSVLSQTYNDFEIVFVDNASIDGSLEKVEDIFSNYISSGKIKIIKNSINSGFTGGNNLGVKNSSASDYIWLLNNDIIADSNALKYLIEVIEINKDVGIVGSLVLDKGIEEQQKELLLNQKKVGINNYIFETSFKNIDEKELLNGIIYTTGIGGCSLLYRKNLIKIPFLESYFAYTEDTFLSFYSILSGYKNTISTNSIINHYGSGTSGKQMSSFKAFHGTKNQICNFFIFHKKINVIKIFPVFFIFQIIKLFSGNFKIRFLGLYKAIYWCIKNRNIILEERKNIHLLILKNKVSLVEKLSPKIFENIYFFKIPKYQEYILNILNKIFLFYFKIIKVK